MEIQHNYLPQQYQETSQPTINHNYLQEQFADYPEILSKIAELIETSAFTLGDAVDEFEKKICELTGASYAIGVGSGTDALFLSLKAIGIKEGDEVITTPYTFFATVGAIVTAGAKPVFVDVGDDYNINPSLIEAAITDKTKAILPVHWSGIPCKMDQIMAIANRYNLEVIEDACHAINGSYQDQHPGTFGSAGCFSLHPLKNLNVWGDGGFIVTNSKEMHDKLVLLRNHGLINRDECSIFAYNSRLDSIQAVVGSHLLEKMDHITNSRIANARFFDEALAEVQQIKIPQRDLNSKSVYHLYVIKAERRDELQRFLLESGIDAKVHYPIPMHLQPAAVSLGHQKGDFPVAETTCDSVLSLPVHEFITKDQQEFVVKKIKEFYEKMAESKELKLNLNYEEANTTKVPFVNLGAQYKNMRNDILVKIDELSSKGDYVLNSELEDFEESFAEFCGVKHAIGVANGTDALILSLKAVNVGEGDEVITAPNSFIATAGAIAAVGAKPVFVDVGSDYNINVELIEAAITNKTKAIVAVHLTGRPAEMDKIRELCNRRNLLLIEDAAQAVGAKYKGRRVGSLGHLGCFSLHPLKNLHAHGDGGIITTNHTILYEKLVKLRNHGLKNRDECLFWGYNSRLDGIQAAILNLKLKSINEWNDRYREIASLYRDGLRGIVIVPEDRDYEEPVYHNFVIMCEKRDELMNYLEDQGIQTKIHYSVPIHLQQAAADLGYQEGDFPVAEGQAKKILSLPIYPELTNEQVQLVIDKINSFFSQ